jgi:hypothetical protein
MTIRQLDRLSARIWKDGFSAQIQGIDLSQKDRPAEFSQNNRQRGG